MLNSAVDVGNYLRVVAAVGPRGVKEPSRSFTVAGGDPDLNILLVESAKKC